MGRWLARLEKNRETARDVAVKTLESPAEKGSEAFEGKPSEDQAKSAASDGAVSKVSRAPPLAQGETSISDPDVLLDLLREHGPMTYGGAALTLAWGASRAWRAEAELRARGAVRLDQLGRMTTAKGEDDMIWSSRAAAPCERQLRARPHATRAHNSELGLRSWQRSGS